ncbi:DUF3072 domain-containing protein [Oceaniglobus trochenteri]|uniref:DUF3072 domain-containing protein n=1 Tax=Oceaniglobus trochenteri TaxID=2763260 RepID=UPI001CFF6149|nr:DUF3072 domain-containing protein [Oceaniglobus trochenteri]
MPKHEDPEIAPASAIGAVPTVDTHGDEPMTDKQAAYLRNLCDKTGEAFDTALSRRQANERIEALRCQVEDRSV